jgi:hypothetical protein
MEHHTEGHGVSAIARRDPVTGKVTVQGQITLLGVQPQTIEWIAAAPTTRGISFAGSGQPYPNRYIALEGTPNKGSLESQNGQFTIHLKDIPAGYYSGLGGVYVPPTIEFYATALGTPGRTQKAVLTIAETAAPFRWLGGAPNTMLPTANTEESTGRAMYYDGREALPIFANQEAALRAKAYPSDMTARGWPEADDAAPWSTVPAPA